jgi:hypothetical protein
VFNFYTNECPPNFQCKGHIQKVRAIDWFENDMGFVSAGQGGDVFFWDLLNVKEGTNRNTEKDFTQKNVAMTGVVNIPGRPYEVYCVGNDGKIWNSNMQKEPYESNAIGSQVCMTHNGKALFCSLGEPNKPGSIVIYKIAED